MAIMHLQKTTFDGNMNMNKWENKMDGYRILALRGQKTTDKKCLDATIMQLL